MNSPNARTSESGLYGTVGVSASCSRAGIPAMTAIGSGLQQAGYHSLRHQSSPIIKDRLQCTTHQSLLCASMPRGLMSTLSSKHAHLTQGSSLTAQACSGSGSLQWNLAGKLVLTTSQVQPLAGHHLRGCRKVRTVSIVS